VTKKQNICIIASEKLCNTCGACAGVCPAGAIHYKETTGGYYLPIVDEDACTQCGLCYEVCPGLHFVDKLASNMPNDPFAGCALDTFVGKATDKQLFENSQSGGIVSALLVHALETGSIKGATTVFMEAGSPPRPVTRIAQSTQEIIEAQKSKYCPVPLLGFIKDLNNLDGPVAVVGIPCQIQGLRNILGKMPNLQNKIAFTIGLVCDRVLTYSALDYLVNKAVSVKSNSDLIIHFRDKSISSYPGDVHVFSENDESAVIPAKTRMQIKDYFTPARCRICFDKMNVFSDITVGDPHGLAGVDRKMGESMLVVRTKLGQEVVQAARVDGAINIRSVDYDQVIKGQGIDKKKELWQGYAEAWNKTGHKLPSYYEQLKKHSHDASDVSKYEKDLQYSLSLDNFVSREELIRSVDKAIRKKQALNGLVFPFRLAKRVVRRIMQ